MLYRHFWLVLLSNKKLSINWINSKHGIHVVGQSLIGQKTIFIKNIANEVSHQNICNAYYAYSVHETEKNENLHGIYH